MISDYAKTKIMFAYILDTLRRDLIYEDRTAAREKFEQVDRKFHKLFLEVKKVTARTPAVFYDSEGLNIIVALDGGTEELCRLNGGCEEVTGERYTELLKKEEKFDEVKSAFEIFEKDVGALSELSSGHSPYSLTFEYKNYKGERAVRTVHPIRIFYGKTEHHPDEQWFMKAYDPSRGDERDFAIGDMVGHTRYLGIAEMLDAEYALDRQDILPVGHVVLEQAENIDGGTVTQTVRRPDGTEYHRIVSSEEAYSFASREPTMVLDTNGTMICVGDVVENLIKEPFQHTHGCWGHYVVEKAPGGYRLSYLKSEKGQILPRGYTGGYMSDYVIDADDMSFKEMVFAQVPVQSSTLTIVREK